MIICDECGYENEGLYQYYVLLGDRTSDKIWSNCHVRGYDVLPKYFEQFMDTKEGDILVKYIPIKKTGHICKY